MNATYAGVFELSVVAGLITVLFISTIALTKGESDVRESKVVRILFPVFFVLFIIIDIIVMKALINRLMVVRFAAPTGNFGQILWGQRTLDLIGQIGVIFAGVFAVIALFRKRDKHE
jgi:NADH-quinone oxidoreductase subunit J